MDGSSIIFIFCLPVVNLEDNNHEDDKTLRLRGTNKVEGQQEDESGLLSMTAVQWLLIIFALQGEDDSPHLQPCWPWKMVVIGSVTAWQEFR